MVKQMRLFIIGNGFDRAHKLPTKFDPHFKTIANQYELNNFWEIYQNQSDNIWSDFENSLAYPDFNALEEIFNGYEPDYYSDRESDRNAIITQVDLNGNLTRYLYEFANNAEKQLAKIKPLLKFEYEFLENDLFITFNYTHTLEKLYRINESRVLHIHGEVGMNNLILGYPEKDYSPKKYYYDIRGKGIGPYQEVDYQTHIDNIHNNGILDYYTYTACCDLIKKTKSFSKQTQTKTFLDFINNHEIKIILILGHSCNIDFDYFKLLQNQFPQAKWIFIYYDSKTRINMVNMISRFDIKNFELVKDNEYFDEEKADVTGGA